MNKQNAPTPQTPTPAPSKTQAPPEAYAAFVRIYIEWMEKNEDDQIKMIERSVRRARTVMDAHSGGMVSGSFRENNMELLGVQFEEYVNTVWIAFRERCDNPDEFALYLQKDFDKYMKKSNEISKEYQEMQETFLQGVFAEWDNKTQNLSDSALDKFFDQELPKRKAEFQKLKADFERRHAAFPSLNTLLRRPAQNMMARRLAEVSHAKKAVSLDDYTEDQKPLEIEDATANGLSQEEKIALDDILDQVMSGLDDQDQKIFAMKMNGYKQTEIAKELGLSDSTISNHIKKIVSMVHSTYSNTGTP